MLPEVKQKQYGINFKGICLCIHYSNLTEKNSDSDSEVQDPLKEAVKEILHDT